MPAKEPKTIITFDDEGNPVVDEQNMKPYHRFRIASLYQYMAVRDAALGALMEPSLAFHGFQFKPEASKDPPESTE